MRQEQQVSSDHPEAVRSAPVPVPPPDDAAARRGRDADGRSEVPEDVLDDRGTFDSPTGPGERGRDDLDDTRPYDVRDADRDGAPEFHEPAPVPAPFLATSVGEAVAASAMAGVRPEDERDPRDEGTARPGDGAPGRTDAFDAERADPTAGDRLHDRDRWEAAEHGGARHAAGEQGHGERAHRATPEHGGHIHRATPEYGGADRDTRAAVLSGAAGYGQAESGMVDPDTASAAAGAGVAGAGATGTDAPRAGAAGAGLAGAGAPGVTAAAGVVPSDATTLFEPDAAQGFRDRWRDVQLRFVDDPKAAAGQAESLVEEAIKALADALAAQKNKLGDWQKGDGDDTEQLRIAVRRYRDFLDRVLGR
jgi:hypothetical protein